VFLRENLRNGITCGCIYCTVYPQSVDALFEEAEKLGMRLAAGKVMMDRNAPEKLLDTPKTGYDDSKALIKKWHNRGGLLYAITPRFAPTSTHEQLEATGALCREHPECYMQTHVSENKGEVAWVKELFIRNPAPVVGHASEGVGEFFTSVVRGMAEVAKIPHVWIASIVGAAQFGVMLALGVVWMPKLLMVHGISQSVASFGASMLWLGLAAGSAVVPWWSDHIKGRKLPIILGGAVQLVCLLLLIYVPSLPTAIAIILSFIFGFANAAHMLAFSTAADVVQPSQIGTSAAIVNGIMFIFGGIMISRPGVRIGWGLEAGLEPKSLELAQYASLPLIVALVVAVALAFYMKETYPRS
jgi:Amidohydrolase family/Major Facilitator Superfamily